MRVLQDTPLENNFVQNCKGFTKFFYRGLAVENIIYFIVGLQSSRVCTQPASQKEEVQGQSWQWCGLHTTARSWHGRQDTIVVESNPLGINSSDFFVQAFFFTVLVKNSRIGHVEQAPSASSARPGRQHAPEHIAGFLVSLLPAHHQDWEKASTARR